MCVCVWENGHAPDASTTRETRDLPPRAAHTRVFMHDRPAIPELDAWRRSSAAPERQPRPESLRARAGVASGGLPKATCEHATDTRRLGDISVCAVSIDVTRAVAAVCTWKHRVATSTWKRMGRGGGVRKRVGAEGGGQGGSGGSWARVAARVGARVGGERGGQGDLQRTMPPTALAPRALRRPSTWFASPVPGGRRGRSLRWRRPSRR